MAQPLTDLAHLFTTRYKHYYYPHYIGPSNVIEKKLESYCISVLRAMNRGLEIAQSTLTLDIEYTNTHFVDTITEL